MKIVPQLFPRQPARLPTHLAKAGDLQAFPLIGETGFEPATARPPARGIGCVSVARARVCWLSWVLVRLSCAQIVPQIVPRTSVRLAGLAETPAWPKRKRSMLVGFASPLRPSQVSEAELIGRSQIAQGRSRRWGAVR